jgi:hypothetical protein
MPIFNIQNEKQNSVYQMQRTELIILYTYLRVFHYFPAILSVQFYHFKCNFSSLPGTAVTLLAPDFSINQRNIPTPLQLKLEAPRYFMQHTLICTCCTQEDRGCENKSQNSRTSDPPLPDLRSHQMNTHQAYAPNFSAYESKLESRTQCNFLRKPSRVPVHPSSPQTRALLSEFHEALKMSGFAKN